MKNLLLTTLFFVFGGSTSVLYAQGVPGADSTGLPGDHFSLQGALQLFQKAMRPDEFEKLLNTQSSNVNNLDLNDDGEIDYVRVVDKKEGHVHLFILQVPISDKESQDIAVIELERTSNTAAVIQIIGDESIYGEEIIIEPDGGQGSQSFVDAELEQPKAGPSNEFYDGGSGVVMNVWFWPSVRFIYGPLYRSWVSPYKWRYYPAWWRPWRPHPWYVFHPGYMQYHRPYVVVHTHRVVKARALYKPMRVSSVSVHKRNYVALHQYRISRTKTTYTGPKGNTAVRTSTTIKPKKVTKKPTKVVVRKRKA